MNHFETNIKETTAGRIIERVSFDEERASQRLERMLDASLSDVRTLQVVIVCVGTDRSTGDAFGPIIGSRMKELIHSPSIHILGTLDDPVHAVNLGHTLDVIRDSYKPRPYVIAIDACLGKFDHVGQIAIEQGPLRPGAGVRKTLPEFGDLTITGIVNVSGFMEYFVLQNTRLGIVMRMSDIVVRALHHSLQKHQIANSIRLTT